jgi:hypothetical protein
MLVLGAVPAWAVDGTVIVKINEALAYKHDNDDLLGPQQDFYAVCGIDAGPPLISAEVGNHDHASWSPPLTLSKTVGGKNQRFFDLYFELWDNDDTSADEDFDISPQNGPPPPNPLVPYRPFIPTGGFPHVTYDVCTGDLSVVGVNGSNPIHVGNNAAELNGYGTTNGAPGNWAALRFEVERVPKNWLPDDVSIDMVEIVQSVYHASKAVVDKPAALHVVIASTYPFDISAPVHGEMTDGISTVTDTRTVTIKGGSEASPGITEVALFDGSTAQPFRPQKSFLIGTGKVSGFAQVIYNESISPNAPIQLQDCANNNNIGKATDLPLMHTNDLFTVYEPFDYEEDLSFVTSQQLQGMFSRDETLRQASWPLATLNSTQSFNQLWRDHGSQAPFFEPLSTLLMENVAAAMAGIDRLVLSVRKGWFGQNAFRHQFTPSTAIGLSLGTVAPRAVLAEDGYFGVAAHELGHTYDLSKHTCTNQSPPFGPGCADEYTHPLSDGRPYEALGFDVTNTVYPSGVHMQSTSSFPNLQCPPPPAWGRDICAVNLMDLVSPDGYVNWLDTFTFQYLLENTIPHSDPFVVNVTGLVRLPAGQGDGSSAPAIQGVLPFFSYQFMGVQDVPDAPLSHSGEVFSGLGAFRIRLVASEGVRDYRFNPRFFANDPNPDLAAGFSINIPWDPMTIAIQLIGPSDGRRIECQNTYCPGDGLVLDQRAVSAFPPSAIDLRAGRDAMAPPTPPGATPAVPTIGPGHDAIVSWDAFDRDSPEIHASLILTTQDAAGGPSGPPTPMAVDISGGVFRIPHDRMAGAPGRYAGRLLVSDGVNTSELRSDALFNLCNFSNGGVELCNGIDDNCDGTTDNAAAPGPVSVELNPQPFPPAPGIVLTWTVDPLAQTHDVVFGDAGVLRSTGGDYMRATLGCLADDFTGTTLASLPTPPVGRAYWFAVRGNNCAGPGTYDSGSPSQVGSRDPGINASPDACRP